MFYLHLENEVITEILPEFDEVNFPGIPLGMRYDALYVSNCVVVDNIENIKVGMYYDRNTKQVDSKSKNEKIDELQKENELLKSEIVSLNNNNATLENCIVEMANIIYA